MRLRRLLPLVSPLALLGAWFWAGNSGLFPEQVLVPPQRVYQAFCDLLASGDLQLHLLGSLHLLVLGFCGGSLLGLAFGVLIGLSATLEDFFAPFFNALRQVPSIAFIPLLILLLGIDDTFKLLIVGKAAFFPVALAAYDTVRGLPRSYLEVARVYRLRLLQLLWRVILPASVPPLLGGLRLALGRAWGVLVAAELFASEIGIGQMMEWGRQMFRLDIVMVGVVLIGLIGLSLDKCLALLERRLVRWKYL